MIVKLLIIWGLFFSGFLWGHFLKKKKTYAGVSSLLIVIILGSLLAYIIDNSSDKAYKESLMGNNPYEIKIVYEQQDSTYIPVDTLFIKREE